MRQRARETDRWLSNLCGSGAFQGKTLIMFHNRSRLLPLMIHARNDYQRIQDPDKKIPQDEPVFMLRAQDQTAAEVVRYWVKLNKRLLAKAADADKPRLRKGIALAEAHSYRMDDWPTKKVADV